MASTFFGLYISGSGLRAANASLNTTANNVSNENTEDYSRQTTVQQAAQALRTFSTYGCAGAGVETLSIERMRSAFYDEKYRQNQTSLGEYSEKNYYMRTIEDYFTDDGKTGFSSVFTAMKTMIQEVLKNPGETTVKQQFLSSARSLATYFGKMSENLEKLQKDINDEIKVKTDSINSKAQELATLNKQINVIELTRSKPNELLDKRDALIDELSKIVNVTTKEVPIVDERGRETGANRFIVRIAGGQTLVDGNDYNKLECVARSSNNRVNQTDIVGLYDVKWENGDLFSVPNASMGGEFAGLLAMRDGNNAERFNGVVKDVDTVAKFNTVTIEVTDDFLTDLTKCNLAEAGTINVGNKLYSYTDWTFEKKIDAAGKETCTYTFTLGENDKISAGKIGKNATTGEVVDYMGVPYYMQQMNEWLRKFSCKFNEMMEEGYTESGEQGCLVFSADYPSAPVTPPTPPDPKPQQGSFTEDKELFTGKTEANKTYTVGAKEDSYYRMTAGNFTIWDPVEKDATLLATKTAEDKTDGESQYSNFTKVLNMINDEKQMSFRNCNAGEFLTCLMGDVALNANNAKKFEENYAILENTIDNQRLQISGVDADEEAQNMVRFKNSYTLASKMISTFSEIYDQLILRTGV